MADRMTVRGSVTGQATLYRMATATRLCPSGLKARDLLVRRGFALNDNLLRTRDEVDRFKAEHGVTTTPQVFIDGVRVGGYDDLCRHFGEPVRDPEARTYAPVLAVFGTAAALALAASHAAYGTPFTPRAAEWAVAFAMTLLAMLKLRDVDAFATMFLGYDLLARRFVPYATIYPWAEASAGVLMAAGALSVIAAPLALVIGTIGAVSVIKAVYIDGRELRCACVGGNSDVPLGFVSLAENVGMVAMGIWMLAH